MLLSGHDFGLVSLRRASYRLVRLLLIPVVSPIGISVEDRGLEIVGLDSRSRLITGDFRVHERRRL
jgi:hypothetical protein